MSFVRLDSGEFPPLGQLRENLGRDDQNGHRKAKIDTNQKEFNPSVNQLRIVDVDQNKDGTDADSKSAINNGCDFVRERVGIQLVDYQEDLEKALRSNHVGQLSDFIVAQIEPSASSVHENKFEALDDLILPAEEWHTRVALDVGFPIMSYYDAQAAKHFDRLFDHATYLTSPVIIVSCPDTDIANACIASTINRKLSETRHELLFLIKVPFDAERYRSAANSWLSSNNGGDANNCSLHVIEERDEVDGTQSQHATSTTSTNEMYNEEISLWSGSYSYGLNSSQKSASPKTQCNWTQWNTIRNHLKLDHRIGVCLLLNDDLADDEEELSRWYGEPVRMVVINTNQFRQPPGHNSGLRLTGRLKGFLINLAVANSLKISFVLESKPKQNVKPYLEYLKSLFVTINYQKEDRLRPWNDKLQPPLQPLSSNLDSGTYWVFEMDYMKYFQYKNAMRQALCRLLADGKKHDRKYILMVLGAGRGPLVDAFITAIKEVDTSAKFKIYALDKNPSSVRTLRYKQKCDWSNEAGLYETEVVEADMRAWKPEEKADIIASELLGSLGDNELSPECLDGVWPFSTPKTISIPQSYSSYIAPICSYRMHQELNRIREDKSDVFEQIYVCRLTNCYHISEPQKLFTFEHQDLSLRPEERCNERYIKLTFYSKVDTVCHGFAGYFTATLFDHVTISTLHENRTENMNSWFPAYIPLQDPVLMNKDSKLVIHFWRKESMTSVWYEWTVTSPVQSKIYSLRGTNAAMSKFI